MVFAIKFLHFGVFIAAVSLTVSCTTDFSLDQLPWRDAAVTGDVIGSADVTTGADVSCQSGLTACAGLCVDISRSPLHCGMCGRACHDGEQCVGGTCTLTCPPGSTECRGSCVRLDTNERHCGRCDNQCEPRSHGTAVCVSAECGVVCLEGYGDCNGSLDDGCETDLANTLMHCGGCGRVCRLPNADSECRRGTCVIQNQKCLEGFADCDHIAANGCEVNIDTNRGRCGGCGVSCAAGQVCEAGMCVSHNPVCDGGMACGFDGACVDTESSVENCGACGQPCVVANGTARCEGGQCEVAACSPGWRDCDGRSDNGCETNINSPEHCGSCERSCQSGSRGHAVCVMGVCQPLRCDEGYADCDRDPSNGCEAQLSSDPANCGTCGRACRLRNASSQCNDGACAITTCVNGFRDCDNDPRTGCEAELRSDDNNCGGCGMRCGRFSPHCCHGICIPLSICL